MNFKQLNALIAIVDAESFTAAAESLSVSQSALTKTIAQLEKELEVKLFERGGGRRAQPTAFGKIVYERGASLLTGVEEMQRYLGQVKRGYSQGIRIGFGVSIPGRHIVQITKHLRNKLPESSVRIRTGLRRHLVPRLRKQEFDLLITMESRGDDAGDLLLDRLWEDEFCVFMSEATKDIAKKRKNGEGMQWLASDRLAELDASASQFLADFLVEAEFAPIDVYDRNAIVAILTSGPYISAWPSQTLAEEVARGDLVCIDIPPVAGRRWRSRVNLVSLAGPQRTPLVASARQLIKRMAFD